MRLKAVRGSLSSLAAALAVLLAPSLSATGFAADETTIGLTHSAASAPLYIAAADHAFAEAGLEAQLKFFDSSHSVEQAVAEGQADFGAAKLTASFLDYAAKHGLKIIAPQVSDQTGYPAIGLLISKPAYDAGFKTIAGLAHRRVALTTRDSGVRYSLMRIADRYGITADTIDMVWLGTPERELAALSAGEVDAAAVPYATALQMRKAGKGAFILRLSDYAESQRGVIFTRAKTIEAERPKVERFMRAYEHGVAAYDLTFQQRDDDGGLLPGARFQDYLALIAQQAGMPAPLLGYALPYCDHLARLDMADLRRQLKFWQDAGLVDKAVTATDLVDLSFNPNRIGS